jgi:hypothetical protein
VAKPAGENEDYVSLEKALKELKLKEEELKRLVSEGEIRAFRDADKMKFRREDIEKLKQDTGKTIQMTEESSDTLTDDLLFDEGEDIDLGSDVGMATAPISSDETFVEAPKAKSKTTAVPPAKGKTQAQPVKPAKTTDSGVRSKAPAATGRTTSIRTTTGASTVVKRPAHELHPGLVAASIATCLVMLFACFVWWDIASGTMSGVTEGIATWASETFAK